MKDLKLINIIATAIALLCSFAFCKFATGEVFILNDGRVFEAQSFTINDDTFYISLNYGRIELPKSLIKSVIGDCDYCSQSSIIKRNGNYKTKNSVVILKSGTLIKSKVTFEEEEFLVCETNSGSKYFFKEDVVDIINPQNILPDEETVLKLQTPKNSPLNKLLKK